MIPFNAYFNSKNSQTNCETDSLSLNDSLNEQSDHGRLTHSSKEASASDQNEIQSDQLQKAFQEYNGQMHSEDLWAENGRLRNEN